MANGVTSYVEADGLVKKGLSLKVTSPFNGLNSYEDRNKHCQYLIIYFAIFVFQRKHKKE